MYILYYLNQNYQIQTIETDTLDAPILIPENLIFTNLRKGINFIKEPHKCIDFTHLERLIMSSEFTDMETIKEGDFRRANTFLTPLCPIDQISFDFAPTYWDNESLPTFQYNDYENEIDVYFSLDGVNFDHFDSSSYAQVNGVIGYNGGKTDIAIYLVPELRTGAGYNTVRHYNFVYFKDLVTGNKSQVYDVSSYWT